jgi:hypothetical protein
MSDQPDVLELDPVIEAMHKLLGGRPPELQGPILADLLATWLAGHFAGEDRRATERMREEMLARHVCIVRTLIPFSEAIILADRRLH